MRVLTRRDSEASLAACFGCVLPEFRSMEELAFTPRAGREEARLPLGGREGVTILHTPGHSPGIEIVHLSHGPALPAEQAATLCEQGLRKARSLPDLITMDAARRDQPAEYSCAALEEAGRLFTREIILPAE